MVGAVVAALLTAAVHAQTSSSPRPVDRFFQKPGDTPLAQRGFNSAEGQSAVPPAEAAVAPAPVPGQGRSGVQGNGADGLNRFGELERAAWMRRFDENGDGRLQPEELAKARAALEAMRGRGGFAGIAPTAMSDRPGRVDATELLRRFDINKDGRLSAAERLLAMRELSRMRGAP